MSLIHDSLRKLETNQSNHERPRLDSVFIDAQTSRRIHAKRLWMLAAVVMALVLISYVYVLLNKYQQQNESLMQDMQQLKAKNLTQETSPVQQTQRSQVASSSTNDVQQTQATSTLLLQQPIQIDTPVMESTYASLVTATNQVKSINNQALHDSNNDANFLLEIAQSKSAQKEEKTPVVNSKKSIKNPGPKDPKLNIKQTRQLVNNLQVQMESGNAAEVENLLKQLLSSSGENSLVYLRMQAYWSSNQNDDANAAIMYNKILFQKPQDIQANTNLALIEARNDKVQQAINRLKALSVEYPDDKNIISYLSKIENQNAQ